MIPKTQQSLMKNLVIILRVTSNSVYEYNKLIVVLRYKSTAKK